MYYILKSELLATYLRDSKTNCFSGDPAPHVKTAGIDSPWSPFLIIGFIILLWLLFKKKPTPPQQPQQPQQPQPPQPPQLPQLPQPIVVDNTFPSNILVHARDAADAKVLLENFDINKLDPNGVIARYTTGLTAETRQALSNASRKGTRIVSTGVPLDIAADIGEVTVVKVWDYQRDDGRRSRGGPYAVNYFAGRIKDVKLFNILKQTEAFKAAFTSCKSSDLDSDLPF